LLAIQAFTTAGIFLFLGSFASRARETGLLLSGIITILTTYGILLSTRSIKGTSAHVLEKKGGDRESVFLIDPDTNTDALNEQIASLTRQLSAEKRRTIQLTFLNELSQQLEAELDPPVAAQLAVNTLEKAMECSMATLMMHESDHQGYVVLAAAGGSSNIIPPGYRQDAGKGLLGRTVRLKKTQIVNDSRLDPDFLHSTMKRPFRSSAYRSSNWTRARCPEICSEKPYAFNGTDAPLWKVSRRINARMGTV
jgi:hypothetical protein